MDWTTGMQKAIDYIEDNILEELDCTDIASAAFVSEFHFQRAFSMLCGCTVGEYIRSRRLSLAGAELASSRARVIDVALKYGYDTPESFAKAFTRFHGVTPRAARSPGAPLKSYSRLSVKIILEGGAIMDYRIEQKAGFSAIGKAKRFDLSGSAQDVPGFWEECDQNGIVGQLIVLAQKTDNPVTGRGLLGLCQGGEDFFEYAIAAETNEDVSGLRRMEVPAQTWAIFRCVGAMPEAIQNMWQRIYREFFPQSDYKQAGNLDFEYYPEGDSDTADYESEIWIPVEKK
jgi:AraC family transcriptional regulator